MATKKRPIREMIAEAIYDDGSLEGRHVPLWSDLSDERRASWLEDADRVLKALHKEAAYPFGEFADEFSGADWMANSPGELWRDFINASLNEEI